MKDSSNGPERISARIPVSGLPGQNGAITRVPIFPLGDPRNRGGPAGLPGEYEVIFTLNRLGYPLQDERSVTSADYLQGDSHLAIPALFRIEIVAEGETLNFEGKPNPKNFLGKISVKCHAKNMDEARDKCYRALMPALSNFSFQWDVPLTVYQTDVKELRTGALRMTHRNPFYEVSLKGQFQFALNPDFRVYGSLYREALTTESIHYQFLCFYRLIESIQARRKRLARELARTSQCYVAPNEIYPHTISEGAAFLDMIFPAKPGNWDQMVLQAILVAKALGKSFSNIAAKHLKPIRDNIAHALLQREKELISVDDYPSRLKVETWLPVAKCIARAMMRNDFGMI